MTTAGIVIEPYRPTFPPELAVQMARVGRTSRFFVASLPEWARWHPALPVALDAIAARPIDGQGRLAAEVLGILRDYDRHDEEAPNQ